MLVPIKLYYTTITHDFVIIYIQFSLLDCELLDARG